MSQHVFTRMLEFDCSKLSAAGYSVFRQLFLQTNEKSGKIKKIFVCRSEEYSVSSTPITELIGYENMWSIILDGSSEISYSATKTFTEIFSFHLAITPKTKPFKVIRKLFYLAKFSRHVRSTLQMRSTG